MADDNIVIQVDDKVNNNIVNKFNAMAAAARSAQSAIDALQASINRTSAAADKIAATAANAATAQQRLAAAAINTQTAQQKLAQATTNAATAATRGQTAQQQLATATSNAAAASARAVTAQNNQAISTLRLQQAQEKATKTTNENTAAIGSYLTKLAAIAGVGFSVAGIVKTMDAYTALQNKLVNVADSQERVNQLTKDLLQLANDTRAPIDETATAFTRFDRALKMLGKSQNETLQMTATINKAFVISGTTATEQASALLQLSQAFNAGKLQGDEFRSIAENMPIVLDYVAKAMNKTTGEVKALSTEGKITAQVLYDAFQLMKSSVDEKFSKTVVTIGQAFNQLKNNATAWLGEANKSIGVTNAISSAILFLSRNMDALAIAATTVGTALLVAFGPSMMLAIRAITGAVTALTVALLRNPLGLVAVAAATAATTLFTLRDSIVEVDGASVRFGDIFTEGARQISKVFTPAVETLGAMYKSVMASMGVDTKGFFNDLAEFIINGTSWFAGFIASLGQMVTNTKLIFTNKGDQTRSIFDVYEETSQGVNKSLRENIKLTQQLRQISEGDAKRMQDAGRKADPVANKPDKKAEAQARHLEKVNAEIQKQINNSMLLGQQREVEQKYDEIQIQLAAKGIKVSAEWNKNIKASIELAVQAKAIGGIMNAIYGDVKQPEIDFNNTIAATNKLVEQNIITVERAAGYVAKARQAYEDSVMPLNAFNRGIKEQLDIYAKIGPEQEIERRVIQERNALLQQGVVMNAQLEAAVRSQAKAEQDAAQVSNAANGYYDQNYGKVEQLKASMEGLNRVYNEGKMSLEQYNIALAQLAVQKANVDMQMGNGSLESAFTASLGKLTEGYQGLFQGLSQTMGDTLTKFSDGFADAFGRAIVYSEDLGSAIESLAKDALAQVISSLIKLGIQYVVNAALAESISATMMATTVATGAVAGAATAAAWAPAAAMVSLATFGANSAAAVAGITTTTAFAKAISLTGMMGFQTGGYTGAGGVNEAAGIVHGKEFVMNAETTSRVGVDTLNALQNGASVNSLGNGGGGAANISINVYNYTDNSKATVSASQNDNGAISIDVLVDTLEQKMSGNIEAGQSPVLDSVARKLGANVKPLGR